MKRKRILIVILIIIVGLTGCDIFPTEQEVQEKDYVFLNLEKSNQYGGEFINPEGAGDYAYSPGAVVEIETQITDGYIFNGWQGAGSADVVMEKKDEDKTTWKIEMNEDKSIEAVYKLEQFKKLSSKPAAGTKDVSYKTDKIKITFNNELGITKSSIIKIDYDNSTDEDFRDDLVGDIIIEENYIEIDLRDYLKLNETYTVEFTGSVWDEDNNLLEESPDFSFTSEPDSFNPDKPTSIGIKTAEDKVELVWEKCLDNPREVLNKYAIKYYIYRSTDNEEFSKIAEVVDPDPTIDDNNESEVVQINHIDEDVNLQENVYYYKISAVDENGNKSDLSKVVSTE